MSGHSKWSTIKRQKGANDAKRGALFTKLSKAISIAVASGGGIGDPSQNFKLRLAVDAARAANMPKENIERAIERASGKSGVVMEEVLYEGFGPGGVGIIVEAATDNKNRTTSEVANAFNKNGGHMGAMGSVSYLFKQIGEIALNKKPGQQFDELFLDVADSGAEDVEEGENGEVYVVTEPGDLAKVRESLSGKGYTISSTELSWKPTTPVAVDDEIGEKIMALMEKIEDLDDVQKTYSNIA